MPAYESPESGVRSCEDQGVHEDWYAMPVLAGNLIRLEPITVEHATAYLAAGGTEDEAEEVFRWLGPGPPRTVGAARQHIVAALAARAHRERFAYAQVDARTGEFVGSTSFYDVD